MMAHFIEIAVDGEKVELEIYLEDIYYKCFKCGEREYGGQYLLDEAELRWSPNIPVEPQFLCPACAAEMRHRTEPLRLAALTSELVSKKAGKRLPPETALKWVEPWDPERFRQLEREFVAQAKEERKRARKIEARDKSRTESHFEE